MAEMEQIIARALSLSPEERLRVIERLWDSLWADVQGLAITEPQRSELDRRIAAMDADPGGGRPWSQVRADLKRRT
ncbi:MAG: addiction module protein [Phycisphaerales bacterium]|nr:addiction module protein [Phycisphaerales bacterium]